jgi:hypothetical protein
VLLRSSHPYLVVVPALRIRHGSGLTHRASPGHSECLTGSLAVGGQTTQADLTVGHTWHTRYCGGTVGATLHLVRWAARRPLPQGGELESGKVAISQLERKRRRWRILYTVYCGTVDESDRRISVRELAEGQQIPLDAVKAIAVELRDLGLVKTRGEPQNETFRMSITPSGRTVVESASLDADPAALHAPSRVTQMDHDARLVLCALAEFSRVDDDPERGHHELDEIDLQGLTNLPTRRLNDAVDRLDRSGYFEGTRFLVGHLLNWQGYLNDVGREAYQRLQLEPVPGSAGHTSSAQPNIAIYGGTFTNAAFQGGHGNTQMVSYAAPDLQPLRELLQEILDRLSELGLPPDDAQEVEAESQAALTQLRRREPNMGAVQESAGIVVRLLEGAGGNIVYDGAKAAAPLAGDLACALAQFVGMA